MGIDNYFRALPIDDELVQLAHDDKEIAEKLLHHVLLPNVSAVSDAWVKHDPRYQLVRDLVNRYPKLHDWHLYGGRSNPLKFARILYYGEVGAEHANYSDPWFEESLAFKFTQGDRVFSEHFKSSTGFPVRVSSPEVVREIAEFSQVVVV